MFADNSQREDDEARMPHMPAIGDMDCLDMSRIACQGMKGNLNEWEIAQPPKLHGKAPSGQDLKFILWILLDVMNLINGSQKIPQECDVEFVTCDTS